MRLIDADAIIKEIKARNPDDVSYEDAWAITCIEHAPTIKSQSGKWIRNDNGTWSCDQCNSWIHDEQHHYARFCLYCGAKMEVEHETD